ncbi:fatty acid desaturase [Actinospica durhamensis]|uniref:Fatty acid desaturase n=1 Tax=Actinospica durhamensis TaxID=1508375 RepID=A0A941IRY5_9ACTN|nr:fatty acid desaturase [Actinospica durhamensis]MBR7839325.1 fatty acid desaturase [Actinospica durhamensis]
MAAGVVGGGGLAARVVGTLLLGGMFAHAAELEHEALHHLGFRSRRANTIAGVALGTPMLIAYSAYRAAHLRHHRDLGTPRNREFFDYGDQHGNQHGADAGGGAVLVRGWAWVVRLSMAAHYARFVRDLWLALRGADLPGESPATSRRIRRDLRIIFGVFVVLTAASVAFGRALVVWEWLVPLVLVAGPVHALVELPEHYRCQTLDPDPFANTRTIRSNRLMAWFTNGNNFHVEHHLMPNLPIGRLGLLHAEVRDRLVHYHPGYLHFLRTLLRPRSGADRA